jgi:glycine/D-amino acid oxidase-like deaminating enzyme
MRVIVVGGGIMGLSTAWAVRRAGHEVVVFEQGPLPNPSGSSHDQHRLIRFPYGSTPGYMRMVREAYAAWNDVWSDIGEQLYAQTGTLVVRRAGEVWSGPSAQAMRQYGIDFESLEPTECCRRYPYLLWSGALGAYFLESGGTLFAQRIIASLADWLRNNGVDLRANSAVGAVEVNQSSVTTQQGTETGDALVVAAGAWVTKLLPELTAMLTPSRQVVIYVQAPPDTAHAWESAPMVLDQDSSIARYIVPPRMGAGLKFGDHKFTNSGDPAEPRGASAQEAEEIKSKCGGLVRDIARYAIINAKDCYYTVSAGERFVVRKIGKSWIVSACSGHGFKFGALIGKAMAAAIAGAKSAAELSAWAAGEG